MQEVVNDKNFIRLQGWLKQILPNDWDKIDLEGLFDSTLSHLEMKNVLREHVKVFLADSIKEGVEYQRAETEKLRVEAITKAETEVAEYNKNLSFEDNKDIDQYYSQIIRAVSKVCKGHSNLCLISGQGGTGKSVSIKKTLVNSKVEYVEVNGDVTEAYLYRLLLENNGKVIWFRDNANKLFSGSTSTVILKAATETEESRVITKSNYSKQQEDLPDRFICKCRFIFDFNVLTNIVREDFEALVSRGDYIHFALSQNDMVSIMSKIAKKKEEKEVTKYVIEKFKSTGIVRLNLRTQFKAFETYKYCIEEGRDWRNELDEELTKRISKDRALLYGLIGDKAVRKVELKKILMASGIVHNVRSSEHLIAKYIFCDELFEVSSDERNCYVCINQVAKVN